MIKPFRLSLRELLLLTAIAVLAVALWRAQTVAPRPIYLHVFGTMVDSRHDGELPSDSPKNIDGRPWTRIATVEIFDGAPFGFFTPNDRSPAIGIGGKLARTWNGDYRGRLHFTLDDNNLTYDFSEDVELRVDSVRYIDEYFDCYVLSHSSDPYEALRRSLPPQTP